MLVKSRPHTLFGTGPMAEMGMGMGMGMPVQAQMQPPAFMPQMMSTSNLPPPPTLFYTIIY